MRTVGGLFVLAVSSPAAGCGPECEKDEDCEEPDDYCASDEGTCRPQKQRGESCWRTEECYLAICVDWTCAPKKADGEPCEQSEECAGGLCVVPYGAGAGSQRVCATDWDDDYGYSWW